MNTMASYLALLLSLCTTAFAQTLEIAPVTVDQGSANILRIVLKPRPDKPIAALQWELVYREGLRIEPASVVTGMASEAAGKSVVCALKPADGSGQRLACIVSGGARTLGAGAIAIVRFEAAKDTSPGEKTVGLEKIAGVSAALEPVPIENSKTTITVR
jgi:hypothetical protein